MNNKYEITPKVDQTQEFIEIANDFSNPLDLVREAISNAYDAKANAIWITFEKIMEAGERILKITLLDNGHGMDKDGLQAFFDLGNSSRRGDDGTIGEKGHGTKVYFNSKKIQIITIKGTNKLQAVMDTPYSKLHDRKIPHISVESVDMPEGTQSGTEITIYDYNKSRSDRFSHEILKDYILWFSKHGAIENMFDPDKYSGTVLHLKGLGRDLDHEQISFGHIFPAESAAIDTLFDRHKIKAPDYYCKRIVRSGTLKADPSIRYQAIFSIEGKNVKYEYNPMLRRPGYSPPAGAYTIQERYGVWLCRDFIPVQRKNEWITSKGSEYTKFHAFFNCQYLRLTANRGSVENTPSEIMQDIEREVKKIYDEIMESEDWTALEWLEDEALGFQTIEKEKKDFKWRLSKINKSNVATYSGVSLVEPERESGVLSLFLLLSQVDVSLFPFQIVDYDTHSGVDVIAKGDKTTPIAHAKLFYVEFKRNLAGSFNHSFENLHSIVCWETEVKHDDSVTDIAREERKMVIVAPKDATDYTRYYLTNDRSNHKIEIFVLKQYLKEKRNIEFKPRTKDAVV